jgi:tetratricopeptide (TPR) repeat protein
MSALVSVLFFGVQMLRYFAIIFLGLFAGGEELSPAPSQPQVVRSASAEGLLQQGLEAYRAHQLTQAVDKLKQAYQLAPGNPKVCLALGLMLYEQDPSSLEAQGLLESVASQFPDNFELQLKLLDSYLHLKNESKLSSLLYGLRDAMAGNTRFAFNVIYTLVRYSQLEPAKSQLDKISARLQPKVQEFTEQELKSPAQQALRHDAGEVHFIRGMIAASLDDKSEAMLQFQKADRCDFPPRDSFQMKMLAEALFRMQEYPLSVQAYEVYLKHFPNDVTARMQIGIGYHSTGNFAVAKENFLKVLQQAPQTPEVHLYFGMTLLELKSNGEAREQFQAELKSNPKSFQAMAELAYLDYLGGDNEGCRQWLEKARAWDPDWFDTNMVFGLLYNRLGEFDRAIEYLEQAVKQRPNYYKTHFQLSLAYRRKGDETKAKEHADIYDRLVAEERSRQLGAVSPKN